MWSTQADNNSRKLRLRCGCQVPWCALALPLTMNNVHFSCIIPTGCLGDVKSMSCCAESVTGIDWDSLHLIYSGTKE
jgi:hypothetical protein